MKKHNRLNKIITLLLILSLSAFLFAGCAGKSNQGSSKNANGSNSTGQRANAEEMKKNMQTNLSSLVKDGTITQAQADKILEALTANRGGNRQNNNQNNGQNNTQNGQSVTPPNNGQGGAQVTPSGNGQGGQQGAPSGSRQNGQRFNPLSSLVKDGTITQAQADTVMNKIRGNFGPAQNSQNKN